MALLNLYDLPGDEDPTAPPPAGPPGPGGTTDPIDLSAGGAGTLGGGAGGGGNGGGGGSGFAPRPTFNFGAPPNFVPPQFNAPTFEQAQQEPGYQFRLGSGRDALERSAAARGVLRTGGTLTDIIEYGQNFGAQEYGNVYNRALQAYDRLYRGARDAFAPKMAEYDLRGRGELAAGLAGFDVEHRGGGGGFEEFDPEPVFEWVEP